MGGRHRVPPGQGACGREGIGRAEIVRSGLIPLSKETDLSRDCCDRSSHADPESGAAPVHESTSRLIGMTRRLANLHSFAVTGPGSAGRPVKVMLGGMTGWADEGFGYAVGTEPGSPLGTSG